MSVESQSVALRMVIVDDNWQFLNAARTVLRQAGANVVGIASTSDEALRLAEENGFDLAERLATADAANVVLISAYPEAELTDLVAPSPAVGFVPKSELSAIAVSDLLG